MEKITYQANSELVNTLKVLWEKLAAQKPVSEDQRRTIWEENQKENNQSIQAFLIHQENLPLGNHYHNRKIEIFCIIEGGCKELKLKDAHNDNQITSLTNLAAGTIIVMPARVAHTFFFEPGTKMLCFSTTAFNEQNKDMIGCKLA